MAELDALRSRLAEQIAHRERDALAREALRQLRRLVCAIESHDGPTEFIHAIEVCLQAARIDFAGYGVNLIEQREGQFVISQHATGLGEKLFHQTRTQDHPDMLTDWWQQGDTVYRRDLHADDPYDELSEWAARGGLARRSIVDIPFTGGTFAVSSTRPDAFSDADLEFFSDVAGVLDAATQRWQDLKQLEAQNTLLAGQVREGQAHAAELRTANASLAEKDRLLDAFHETGKALLGSLDLDQILDTLALQVIRAGVFRGLMIALVDRTQHKVRIMRSFTRERRQDGAWHPVQPRMKVVGIEYDLDDDNVTAEVARTGELTIIGGFDRRFDQRIDRPETSDKTSYFIPIVHNGHPIAVLATGSEHSELDEMLRQIKLLGPFFDLVAIALHHAHLYHNLQQRERELRESQKLEIMGEMTAGIAHNFNNLLQGVIGNLDFALDAPDEAKSLISKALVSADSLAEMVRQLMAYSRRGLPPERAPTDLSSVVHSVGHVCHSTFDPRIEFTEHIAADVPPVDGNAGQLEQVLLNLCVNARDGVADISGRIPRIEIQATSTNVDQREMVLLQVTDNGSGIDPAVRARMFDPFFTTKDVGRGTGLGLSIVHGIIRDHGGWITCDSETDEGTTFNLYLNPAHRSQAAASEPATRSRSPVRNAGTILLAEDEDAVRHLIGRVLERHGFTVLLAVDGEECLETLAARPDVELVLLDLLMPKLSGREVLKRMPPGSGPPVILFTGFAAPEDVDERVVETLEKPISSKDLVECVSRVLHEHGR
jgi:signal transduction histidine kinase